MSVGTSPATARAIAAKRPRAVLAVLMLGMERRDSDWGTHASSTPSCPNGVAHRASRIPTGPTWRALVLGRVFRPCLARRAPRVGNLPEISGRERFRVEGVRNTSCAAGRAGYRAGRVHPHLTTVRSFSIPGVSGA